MGFMGTRRTEEEWATIIEDYLTSGESMRAWSNEHGFSEKTLSAHVRKIVGSQRNQEKRSKEEWAILIESQAASGLSRINWCKQNGINPQGLYSAISRQNAVDEDLSKPGWVEITPDKNVGAGTSDQGTIKFLIGNMEIVANDQYPLEKLSSLISILSKQ
jgi:hypothetical protein